MRMESWKIKYWNRAGMYLQSHLKSGTRNTWIRNICTSPSFCDFIFLYGNRIYCVIFSNVYISGRKVNAEFDRKEVERLLHVCDANNLTACLMPMMEKDGNLLFPNGWGLIDAREYYLNDRAIAVIPDELCDDEEIEMSDWECLDMASQVVRRFLKEKSIDVICYQDGSISDPQIVFKDKSGTPCALFIRYCVYPVQETALLQEDISDLRKRAVRQYGAGRFFFASVSFAPKEGKSRLIRGEELRVRFTGIEELKDA